MSDQELHKLQVDKELQELFESLQEAGLRPMWCDTPVRVCSCTVKCGSPTEPGDDDRSDYILLPKSILGLKPEMYIHADGDSMIDAGVEAGDLLRVRFGEVPRDGDMVMACLDGRYTVKAFFTDEDGQSWLVPRNDNYDAIPLGEEDNVRVWGVVVGIEKEAPRSPNRSLMQSIRRAKKKGKTPSNSPLRGGLNGSAIRGELKQPEVVVLPYMDWRNKDTSFFILKDGRAWEDCAEKLYKMLHFSPMQSEVLRKIFGADGRDWFDLYGFKPEESAALLNQFPSSCGDFSKSMVKKIKTEYRDIVFQEKSKLLSGR